MHRSHGMLRYAPQLSKLVQTAVNNLLASTALCSSHGVLRHAPHLSKLCLMSMGKLELEAGAAFVSFRANA